MNLLISDTTLPDHLPQCEQNHYIDLTSCNIRNCMGCFGCWVKTPGKCVIRDDAVKIYPLIAQSANLIYVSRLFCGTYDTPLKRLLERAIPVQQAFIRVHHQETHHIQRNVIEKKAVIIAYGDISPREQDLFGKLVARNAHNMMLTDWKIHFVEQEQVSEMICQEVANWNAC